MFLIERERDISLNYTYIKMKTKGNLDVSYRWFKYIDPLLYKIEPHEKLVGKRKVLASNKIIIQT